MVHEQSDTMALFIRGPSLAELSHLGRNLAGTKGYLMTPTQSLRNTQNRVNGQGLSLKI